MFSRKFYVLMLYIIYIIWKNSYCIYQIKTFYQTSNLYHVQYLVLNNSLFYNNACWKNMKNENIHHRIHYLYDFLRQFAPKKIEEALQLQYCLSNFQFTESLTASLLESNLDSNVIRYSYIAAKDTINPYQQEVRVNKYVANTVDTKRDAFTNVELISNAIADGFDIELFQLKEKYLLSILSNLKNNNLYQIHSIFKTSLYGFYSNIVFGKYTVNGYNTLKMELITKINNFLFLYKNIMNKIDHYIKQLITELTYFITLLINYCYFILYSISFVVITLYYLITVRQR